MDLHTDQIRIIPAREVTEGAGVTVHRTIGTPALRNLDPFMMLDHFSSDNPDDYIAGFPPHPHRGFITFTYMIDGHMEHQDSMGNTGNLGPGDTQWMKAASGIIHSEMPKQENGLMRGFQLWINLPAVNKMDDPQYLEFSAASFPQIETQHYIARLLVGQFAGAAAPILDDITDVTYLDVSLQAHARFPYKLSAGYSTALYIFEGSGTLNGQTAVLHTLSVLDPAESNLEFVAGTQGARFILISGRPLNEPVVQYGPFVMNSQVEIEQAMHDYQTNNLVRRRARMTRDS